MSAHATVLEAGGYWTGIDGVRSLPSSLVSSFAFPATMNPGDTGVGFQAPYNMYFRSSAYTGTYRWIYSTGGVLSLQQSINGYFQTTATYYSQVVDASSLEANYVPPPSTDETESFEWSFGAEWSGALVEVRAADGTVLFSEYVPEGGGIVAGEVTAESLVGAEVFLDGISVVDLASGSSSAQGSDLGADRGQYEFEFDSTYGNSAWEIRRADGSVAASGTAGADAVLSGGITVLEGEAGEVWVEQDLADGLGTQFVPTGVTVPGSVTTVYSFVNNPSAAPAATPALPAFSPAPSPLPAPSPVSSTTQVTTEQVVVTTNDVSVDVEALEVPDSDDGEEGVLEQVVGMHEQIRGILEDFEQMFSNVALTYNEFNKVAFGGVGTSCTFEFGEVTINLQGLVPAWLRNGMKLVILLTVLFAAMRMTWETFTSY